MNKEQLRKELEDVFWIGWNICERYHNGDSTGYENKIPVNWIQMDYEERIQWYRDQTITTRLAALDDGDDIPSTLFKGSKPMEGKELEILGKSFSESMSDTPTKLDDGQEGKGLEGTLNENKPMEEGHQTVKCYTSEELEKSFLRSACEGYQDAKFNGKKHENVYALINPIQSKEWFKWLEEKNVIK